MTDKRAPAPALQALPGPHGDRDARLRRVKAGRIVLFRKRHDPAAIDQARA